MQPYYILLWNRVYQRRSLSIWDSCRLNREVKEDPSITKEKGFENLMSFHVQSRSLICSLFRNLFEHLLTKLNRKLESNVLAADFKDLIFKYNEVVKCLNNMDKEWSPLAFFAVFACMTGLFRGCYLMAFYSNITQARFYSLLGFTSIGLWTMLLILVSASVTNELSRKTKNLFFRLTHRITSPFEEIKRHLKECLTRENRLTLWNIYIVDKSLIISSFGTLLTYGILLGTLGKTN
ncbi:uncharacterized protein NPIL_428331 [Nephila pilipes]|uniref:Gustatory receptor n=1 Tax=Nephila pilipes TaxID=299642 RepID=A0A8X6M813_NEPPI|nr:uncharacterized protein NPIL_428331 [Nephila pilipes]